MKKYLYFWSDTFKKMPPPHQRKEGTERKGKTKTNSQAIQGINKKVNGMNMRRTFYPPDVFFKHNTYVDPQKNTNIA